MTGATCGAGDAHSSGTPDITFGFDEGPACDSVCTSVGFLAGKWNMPLVSFACAHEVLMDRNEYQTFGRSTVSYHNIVYAIKDIVAYYKWDRILLVEGHEDVWRETAEYFMNSFETDGIDAHIWTLESDQHLIELHMATEIAVSRVMVICAYGVDIIHLLCAADALGILTGQYVFITIDYSRAINLAFNHCNVSKVEEGVLDITPDVFRRGEAGNVFLSTMQNMNVTTTIHAGLLYDAFRLYGEALDKAYTTGFDINNISNITHYMRNVTFIGAGGSVHMTEDGVRDAGFVINNIHNGEYISVAYSTGTKISGSTIFYNVTVHWPGQTTVIPTGQPLCGWDGALCPPADNSQLVTAIGSASALLFCLVTSIMALAIYYKRKMQLQSQLQSLAWKINSVDLNYLGQVNYHGSHATSKSPLNVSRSRRSSTSLASAMQEHQVFVTVAKYHGVVVATKTVHKSYIAVTGKVIKEINQMRSLKHDHVHPILGACVETGNILLISEYCPKGSLQDVLMNEHMKLDRIFSISFASDISKGMTYIHSSQIECHGRLKSTNVFVDSHWMCKVGDMNMPNFREGEREEDDGKHAKYSKLLWTAPEILRDPYLFPKGSQKADVYAYAIILQEIMTKSEPYCSSLLEPDQITARVKSVEHPPYRPKIPVDCADEAVLDLMRVCWEEIPIFRPSFVTIGSTLRKCNKGKTTNLVDQMIHMMEKYADHLEEVVEERTQQLEAEQRRTEELLCRMLPKSISNALKCGITVVPETYEEVTVFFSDIVGFTALSSESTPMQVVNFLNDLYTCFDAIIDHYDVYKVETIGDAYMVVSGLPTRNGKQHAGEIATLALDLLNAVTTFTIRHRPDKQLQLRIGIHSGPVVAGVVGRKMPRYCLFGDTVNYASRMESTGLALKIHVSPETTRILRQLGDFRLKLRGPVAMKGKGIVETFFLEGKDGFEKQLPVLEGTLP